MGRHYRYNEKKRNRIRSVKFWIAEGLVLLLLAFLFVYFFFQLAVVHGNAMKPNYQDGEIVFINKFKYKLEKPKRNDVVMIRLDDGFAGRYIIRRIVALPGEYIQIINGRIYVNGEEQEFPEGQTVQDGGRASLGITLGEDEYFVMGDHCNNSEDSRSDSIGNIHLDQIVGKVIE